MKSPQKNQNADRSIKYIETEHSETLSHVSEPLEITFDLPTNPDRETKVSVISFDDDVLSEIVDPLGETNFEWSVQNIESGPLVISSNQTAMNSRKCLTPLLSALTEYAWSYPSGCWFHAHNAESPAYSHLVFLLL